MNILILDDIQFRLDTFKCVYTGHAVTTATHFHEFVRLLKSQKWDLVHLDHDLGDFVDKADTFIDGWDQVQEYNGCHAVDEICSLEDAMRPTRVIIHSINGPGSAIMHRQLLRFGVPAVREPFTEIDPDVEY